DWGRPTHRDDPFVGFHSVHPLFVLNEEHTRYQVAPSRLDFFRPESFAREKTPGEFRIFCLGGSTVQGRPFAIETSFPTWLELGLEAANPERKWEVVNCGGVSYASYRLVPILEEVLEYEPDLVLVYTGHNEFLEDRTYAHIKQVPRIVARPCELLLRTRTYTLLREGHVRLRGRPDEAAPDGRPVLASEVDAMLEYRGGLDEYHRDDKWRRDVIEHFRFNLRRMVDLADNAGVPLLLVNPVSNLRDSSPFKTQHRDGLTPEELQRWEALVAEAADHYDTNAYQAATVLEKALEIDDQHAGLHYLLAKCYDASGVLDRARRAYLEAKELDICPLRILEPMNQSVLDVARRTDTPLVDVRKLYEDLTDSGIPGGYGLLDHVHPSIPGHQLIANALADELVRQGVVHPVPDWKENRDRRFREHLASLDDLYFAKGVERLERLRCWTQGKADGVRPASGPPEPPRSRAPNDRPPSSPHHATDST
ncbi:MAG: SGNH/GDSL hydrolase family protein, partial [Planctomycetes bacterium]|nr:SGNH/GDSL hydrolase family protein [Planctomycetota bacterium]